MPGDAARICTSPGCSRLVRDGGNRCHLHPAKAWVKSAGLDGTTTERGYGHAWRKLRTSILERDGYLCQVALAEGRLVPASEVDHVISKGEWLSLHGTLHGVDDPSNLQAISQEAHRDKTLREAAEARGY